MDELRGNGVEIARKSQRPRKVDDEDSDQEEDSNNEPRRRNTLYKLHDTKNLESDSTVENDLQTNFEMRFEKGIYIQKHNMAIGSIFIIKIL